MLATRSDREAAARIASGASWSEFCKLLELAGEVILRDGSPSDPLDRAEGFRYLSRLVRAGLETFVENADPRAPVLQRVVHETVKMGADNPDNYYQNAAISGAYDYRITGHRGTVHYLSFGAHSGGYGQGRGLPPTGFLEAGDLAIDAGGRFEIVASQREHPGNWLRMTEDTGTLIVRQTFLDRATETRAELAIERIDGDPAPAPVTPAAIDAGLGAAAALVGGAAALFAGWAESFRAHTNELPRFDQATSNAFGGDPNIAYYHSYWELEPDQALVIEATPPACDHWNFQLNNHWMESLDYRYFPVTINKHTARYRDDGSVRVVVGHRDPGVDNWLDTVGHRRGTMCWRWIRADAHPQPATRVVAVSELA